MCKINMNKRILPFALCFLSFTLFAQSWPPAGMLGDGTSGDPWQITDSSHLRILADYVNVDTANGNATIGKYYKLMNDIDLSGYADWEPIGGLRHLNQYGFLIMRSYFSGNFDGNGKIVQNLTVNDPYLWDGVGLFGVVDGGNIENLGIVNCNVIGGRTVAGGLVGYFTNYTTCTIANCFVTGNVSIGISQSAVAGGLVGTGYALSISNCYFEGNVTGGSSAGGLLGILANSTIFNCYAIGNVRGVAPVGGLIGTMSGLASGGEGGSISCIMSNCYAANTVHGVGYNAYVGGLVGELGYDYSVVIRNCVAANDSIIRDNYLYYGEIVINRIVGRNYGGTLQNNYALNTMVVQDSNGNVPIISNLNTEYGMDIPMDSLKSFSFYNTFNNWYQMPWSIQDTLGVWKICDGRGLPFLRWQGISCIFITATAIGNGSISPSGVINIDDTSSQTFIFTPNTCYEIDSLWIDSVYEPDSIAAGSYTFNNITTNHSIEVSFKRLPPDTVIISDTICYGINYSENGFNITNAIADSVYFNNDFNTNGCDSVTRLELTVNPLIHTQISDSICEGYFYDFHGDTLMKSGIYYDTLLAISGCDSIIKLTLTVISIDTTHISIDICEGDSCDFFGRQLTEEGIYYETLQTIHGCDSVIELTLTVEGVGIVETRHATSLRIYPNPTDGKLIIESGELKIKSVEIFDITGQVIKTYNSLTTNTIDISELPNAMYFITFHSKEQKITRKLVKY